MKRIQKSQRTAEVKDNNSQEGKGNVICIFFVIFPYSDRLDRLDLNILWQNIIEFSGPEKVNDRLPVDGCPSWKWSEYSSQSILTPGHHTHTQYRKESIWIDKYIGKGCEKLRTNYLFEINICCGSRSFLNVCTSTLSTV